MRRSESDAPIALTRSAADSSPAALHRNLTSPAQGAREVANMRRNVGDAPIALTQSAADSSPAALHRNLTSPAQGAREVANMRRNVGDAPIALAQSAAEVSPAALHRNLTSPAQGAGEVANMRLSESDAPIALTRSAADSSPAALHRNLTSPAQGAGEVAEARSGSAGGGAAPQGIPSAPTPATSVSTVSSLPASADPSSPPAVTPALLRLLQLTSPALPIGAYAYSQGLESAVHAAWVRDEETAAAWILGLLEHGLANLDAPLLLRLHAAWHTNTTARVDRWNAYLVASRASAELRAEDQRLGNALARLLASLDLPEAAPWIAAPHATHLCLFALASARWEIPASDAVAGFLFSWAENQVGAATRLVPLGQTSAQRILSRATALIPALVAHAHAVADDDLGFAAPAHAIAAALHETQYSRIFRS